jgi:putative aldouronate transport system substrate-binding protein
MKVKCIFLAFFLLVVLIPGCNSTPVTTQEQETTGEEWPLATLTFYFPQLTGGAKPDAKLVLSEMESMTASLLNIKLDFNWISPGLYAKTIAEKIASGGALDAFYCGLPGQGLLDFTVMAREGLLADLTDALPTYAPALFSQYDQNDLDCALVDGNLVAIPPLFPMADNIYAIVRQDYMEKYGLPAIKTFDDYGQYLATVKQNETGIIPGKIADSTVALFARASGYAIFDKENFLVYRWNDDTIQIIPWEQTAEFRNVAAYLSDWAENDYLELAAQGVGNIWNAGDMIINGKISSFLFAGEYRVGETIGFVEYSLNNYLKSNRIPGEIAAYRLYPDLQAQRLNPVGNGLTTGSIAISAETDDVDRILMFLDWVQSSQEHYDIFMYGIEGKHYQLQGEQIDFPEGVTIDQNTYLGWDGRQAFKNLAYERFAAGLPSEAKESYTENIRTNTVLAPHEGFYADYSHIAELLEQRRQAIIAEIEFPLLTGVFDLNDIDILVGQLKKSGTDDIIADLQTQIASDLSP